MFNISYVFVRLLAALYSVVFLIGAPAAVGSGDRLDRAEGCRLNVNIVSDIHMEGNSMPRKNIYIRSLRNMDKYTPGLDALAMAGDNTMNGFDGEGYFLYGLTARLLPDSLMLPVCGNHDVGNGEGDFAKKRSAFLRFYNAYHADEPIQTQYYSREVNGVTFIMLASEDNTYHGFSETQLNWFRGELDRAAADGRVVFVGCHYPLTYLDDEFEDAITAHSNIYYFCGHLHRSRITVQPLVSGREDLWYINLPRLTEYNESDGSALSYTGLGLNVQVTDAAVTMNLYNFYTAKLIDSVTAPIV